MSNVNKDIGSLEARMKAYERVARTSLTPRMPVILRLDGKAFHTYTSGCKRPFDQNMSDVMTMTAEKLCEEVQGTVLAYTQSDEISLLVHSYKRFSSQAWFDNQVQKMVSVAAGVASTTFTMNSWKIWQDGLSFAERFDGIRPAVFDCRVFVLPETEVTNYFIWRQQDAMRNSVQQFARSMLSHKQCENKNVEELKRMCLMEKGADHEKVAPRFRKGLCLKKQLSSWVVDDNVPVFSQERGYVNDLLVVEEE